MHTKQGSTQKMTKELMWLKWNMHSKNINDTDATKLFNAVIYIPD